MRSLPGKALMLMIGTSFIVFGLSGCVTSRVGGERRETIANNAVQSVQFDTYCSGECVAYSESGSCVTFTSGISDVCANYFLRIAAINGDCNVLIQNNYGRIDVDYGVCTEM